MFENANANCSYGQNNHSNLYNIHYSIARREPDTLKYAKYPIYSTSHKCSICENLEESQKFSKNKHPQFMINTQIHSIFENRSKSAKGNYTNLNIQEVFSPKFFK